MVPYALVRKGKPVMQLAMLFARQHVENFTAVKVIQCVMRPTCLEAGKTTIKQQNGCLCRLYSKSRNAACVVAGSKAIAALFEAGIAFALPVRHRGHHSL
jgi:hypothetical protein